MERIIIAMGCSSGKKRIILFIVVAILAIITFLALLFPVLGRALHSFGVVTGPYDHPGSVWVSTDPSIHLEISTDGVVQHSSSFIESKEGQIPVYILVQPDRAWVIIRTKSGDSLIMGELTRCDEDAFSFSVVEDNLFSGEYQTITLTREH